HAGVTTSGGQLALQEHPLWTVPLPGTAYYPLIAGGTVFVTVGNAPGGTLGAYLYAFDAQTGATRWGPGDITGNSNWAGATSDAGKVFAIKGSGVLASFDATTGAAGWSVALGGGAGAPPTASNGVIYAVTDLALSAIDEASGNVLWSQQLAASYASAATV